MALVYPYYCTGRPEDKQLAKDTLLSGTVATLMSSEGCFCCWCEARLGCSGSLVCLSACHELILPVCCCLVMPFLLRSPAA